MRLVFASCLHSSREKPKTHNWSELEFELSRPPEEGSTKGVPLERSLDYCLRCGLLRPGEGDVNAEEEIECDVCLEEKCVCDPCELCKLLPKECDCEECVDCGKCDGEDCDVCTKRCTCSRCKNCDLPIAEGECSDELEC